MNNYNNINITPVLIKKALWGVAAIAIISVGMGFRPSVVQCMVSRDGR